MVIRRTSNERGVLVANGKSQGCVVKDISSNGARLQLGGPNPLPQRFQLELTGRGERVGAQLVWQNGTEAGVQFLLTSTWGKALHPSKWIRLLLGR
jgi:hypothetical protein